MKSISEYPDYLVTKEGVIYSTKYRKPRALKTFGKDGYSRVSLSSGSLSIKPKCYLVHRLVAQSYIPNPDNLPFVNHIDQDKSNNNVDNLEWCSFQYNIEYSQSKYYTIEHISTGDIFEIFNMEKYCRNNGLSSGHLIGTYTRPKERKQHKGFRVIKVTCL